MSDMIRTWHIANDPNLYNPQQNHLWDLMIMGIDGQTNPLTKMPFINAKESLTIALKTAETPNYASGSNTVSYGNRDFKFSNNKQTFENISLTVQDLVGTHAEEIVDFLCSKRADAKTGVAGKPSEYMFTAYLYLRDAAGTPQKIWKIEYASFVNKGKSSLDRTNQDVRTFTVDMEYSLATREL